MIDRVLATNFQSWGNLDFPITNEVTLVDGFNYDDNVPEGSGKSAILNAMCWCFFGKLPKEANIDEVIKDGEKSCGVEVWVSHPEIKSLFRTRGPNRLGMVDLTDKVIQGKDARETQVMIETFLGMSFDTFCQTVYFAQGFSKKFVTAIQEERGKILAEIQDLEVFDRGKKEIAKLVKVEEQSITKLGHEIDTNKIKLSGNVRLVEQQKQFYEKQKRELTERAQSARKQAAQKEETYSQMISQRDELLTQIDESVMAQLDSDRQQLEGLKEDNAAAIAQVQGQKVNIVDYNKTRANIQKDLQAYRYRKEKLAKERRTLVEFIENPTDVCVQCGTTLGSKDTTHAQGELAKIDAKLTEEGEYADGQEARLAQLPEVSVQELDVQLQELCAVQAQLRAAIAQVATAAQVVNNSKAKLASMNSMIEHVGNDYNNLLQQAEELENTVVEEPAAIAEIEAENFRIDETVESLGALLLTARTRLGRLETLKAGFGEVKSYTFNAVLNELTARSNKYLMELFEMPISLKFTNDDMKIGLEFNVSGTTRSFGLFSGGQQRRIQLAVDLALSDIVSARTGTGIKLLILDEYFKDLSEPSMRKILVLLEKIGRPTILIEHNSIFKSIVSRTFMVELRNGTTEMVA